MAEQARILVVDDEPAVQNALSRALALERYDVAQAVDGRQALECLQRAAYEVVILDVSMPYVDGLEVCRRLRDGGDRTPVLMLTAREQVDDRVAGLDAGADDYLVKPFALRELLARVRALLRRSGEEDEEEGTLSFEDLRLDRLAHEAFRGERTRLSPDLTFYMSEFSKLRLQYNYDHGEHFGDAHSVWLQMEFLLGAHAAHKF